jgi:LDH2 family malate/lactate/ureidoglycolate dehydrogenase
VDPSRAQRTWPGADQGSFIVVADLSRFMPVAQFKAQMDEYARKVRQLKPLPGYDRALLAGAPEWERSRQYTEAGIPVSPEHAKALKRLAAETNLEAPV